MVMRANIDRRFQNDSRRVYDLDHFSKGGIERRRFKERRSQFERRVGWMRVSAWASVFIEDIKAPKSVV